MKKTDEKIFSEGDFNELKRNFKKGNRNRIKKELEKQKQLLINRGKIKILDELFRELDFSSKTKALSKFADPLSEWNDESKWTGLILSEKIISIKDIIQDKLDNN